MRRGALILLLLAVLAGCGETKTVQEPSLTVAPGEGEQPVSAASSPGSDASSSVSSTMRLRLLTRPLCVESGFLI